MKSYCIINNKRIYNISKFCVECGSTNDIRPSKINKRNLCFKHYLYERNHGKINKTKYDKNEYILKNDKYEIVLYDNNIKETGRAIIDIDDYDKVKDYKWYMNKYGYAVSRYNKSKKSIWLQNLIMDNLDLKFIVDHKNRMPLDCSKNNLRKSDKSNNSFNSNINKNNTSGVTGVMWLKNQECWCAYMEVKDVRNAKYSKSFDKCVKNRIIFESLFAKEFSPNYNPNTNTIQLSYVSHDDNKETYVEVSMDGEILTFSKK